MAIYTKLGDRGKTSLYDLNNSQRNRVSKSSKRIEAIGGIDALNSCIGVLITKINSPKIIKFLKETQRNLFIVGSIIAGSSLRFPITKTKKLERIIDEYESKLPVLSNFILPGGGDAGSQAHFVRSLTRNAERSIVSLSEEEKINEKILMYINRLSDYFFILSRWLNHNDGVEEDLWKV